MPTSSNRRPAPVRDADSLDALLSDARVSRATADHRDRLRCVNGIGMACEVLERVAAR